MSAPSPVPVLSDVLRFERNRKFLGGPADLGVVVTATRDVDVAVALAQDQPFPKRKIEVGNISLGIAGAEELRFGRGKNKVAFSGNGEVFSGLGVYPDPKVMLGKLDLNENIAPAIRFAEDPDSAYVMLRWGYDIGAVAKGAVGLGTGGSVTFGAEGSREGAFAVIRRLPSGTGARTALSETLQSWMLPRQVSSDSDLAPGTWIVSEVNGSVGASLGVQFGYDFSWVHEAELGGLTGDIGLRLQLGVAAALGFRASGKYVLVVSREDPDPANRTVRVRLFKLSTRGWNFGFNLGVRSQANFSKFLPDRSDDFVKAVFGVQGEQIIGDLKAIENWIEGGPLTDQLADLTSDYVQKFVRDVTGIDPKTEFNEARDQVLEFVRLWDELPSRVSSLLLKSVEKKADLDQVRGITELVAGSTRKQLAESLASKLGQVSFFQTEEGKFLEALAGRGILAALDNRPDFDEMQKAAKAVLGVLDGSTVERTLVGFNKAVARRLNLDLVRNTDFDKLDAWMQAKLSSFLGQRLNAKRLEEIRKTIDLVLRKREEFYRKALTALNRKYEFSIAHTYQSTTSQTALFDIECDFAGSNAVRSMMKAALDGDFSRIMVTQVAGVTLNSAALTHGIERQSHIEVSLPFLKKDVTRINRALARANAVDEEDGRVLVYELDARSSLTSVVERKMLRDSTLAIGGQWRAELGNAVRRHDTEAVSYSYSFRQACRQMRTAALRSQIKPYVGQYFPSVFSGGGRGAASESFDTWVQVLDRFVEDSTGNGADVLGNTLISLELSLPGNLASAWVDAPGKSVIKYRKMSHGIQAALKQLIPWYFFQNPANYKNLESAAALLLYASIPPSTSIKVMGSSIKLDTNKRIYWDHSSARQRKAMAQHPATLVRLRARMLQAASTLESIPKLAATAEFYQPDDVQVARIVRAGLGGTVGGNNFEALLRSESAIVKGAYAAGGKMAEFRKAKSKNPEQAVAALAGFGAELTATFNKDLKSRYGGDSLRPMGTLVFAAAAEGLMPATASEVTQPRAMLSLSVLRDESDFDLARFAKNERPDPDEVVVEERLVSV